MNLSQHFPEMHVCPAVSEEETTVTNQYDDDNDGAFDEDKPNPWAVKQMDGRVVFEVCTWKERREKSAFN